MSQGNQLLVLVVQLTLFEQSSLANDDRFFFEVIPFECLLKQLLPIHGKPGIVALQVE